MAATPLAEKWKNLRVRHVHRHPPVHNINEIEQQTVGQRVADRFATIMGSWTFIIIQSAILAVWVTINALAWAYRWDPYPFILLNLALSFQAAYAAPIIMMSQNRQAAKDRIAAENDYMINLKAEDEVKVDHESSRTAGRNDDRHPARPRNPTQTDASTHMPPSPTGPPD